MQYWLQHLCYLNTTLGARKGNKVPAQGMRMKLKKGHFELLKKRMMVDSFVKYSMIKSCNDCLKISQL